MSDKQIRLQVMTPSSVVLDRQVDSLVLRTSQGDMGVLPGHEACAVTLGIGILRGFGEDAQDLQLAVMGGFATVREDTVSVLTFLAEPPDRIDAVFAQMEQDRADNVLREQRYEAEIQRAESALRRILVQQDMGAHSVALDHQEEGEDEAQP